MPVELFPSPHATALGIASLARHGADASSSISQGLPKTGRHFEPLISGNEAEEQLTRWEGAAARVLAAVRSGRNE
jgi:glycerol kinase